MNFLRNSETLECKVGISPYLNQEVHTKIYPIRLLLEFIVGTSYDYYHHDCDLLPMARQALDRLVFMRDADDRAQGFP